MTSQDGNTSIHISIAHSGDKTAREIAQIIANDNLDLKPVVEVIDASTTIINAIKDGLKICIIVTASEDKVAIIMMAGKDQKSLDKILESLESAESQPSIK